MANPHSASASATYQIMGSGMCSFWFQNWSMTSARSRCGAHSRYILKLHVSASGGSESLILTTFCVPVAAESCSLQVTSYGTGRSGAGLFKFPSHSAGSLNLVPPKYTSFRNTRYAGQLVHMPLCYNHDTYIADIVMNILFEPQKPSRLTANEVFLGNPSFVRCERQS